MKKNVFCLIFAFASSLLFAQFPVVHQIQNLVTPVQLEREKTTLHLADYFLDIQQIDSITLPKGFEQRKFLKLADTVVLQANAELNLMAEMKIWSHGFAYMIPLKKSKKELVSFELDAKGKEYKEVKLAGEMNDWNPNKTVFSNQQGIWKAALEINPGKYQYQLVLDGKWQLDPANADSADNGNGKFNSVKVVGSLGENMSPQLRSAKVLNDSCFSVSTKFPQMKTFVSVFWQNFKLGKEFVHPSQGEFVISIPAAAKNYSRSFIRVFAWDENDIANDLLIPLENGKVITDSKLLNRNDKQAASVYFVLVDRFKNGNKANDRKVIHPEIKAKANYFGGDLEGVTEKINSHYFENLGFNTVWLSPLVQNPEKAYKEFPEPHDWYSGYHGYWPISLNKVDDRFGGDEALKKLVQQAHKNKLNVLLDLVANHVHEDYPLLKKHPEWRTPLDLPDGRKNIRIWEECRLTTWFDSFLPTLDFYNKEVRKLEVDSSINWLKKFEIDGFRHDATKHVPEIFWRELTTQIKKQIELPQKKSVYQIGETYGSKELIGSYIGAGMLDGQFDFNLYFIARNAFAKDSESLENTIRTLKQSLSFYGSHHLMGNISGNHDQARVASLAGGALSFSENDRKAGWEREVGVGNDIAYQKVAMLNAFNATIPGVPFVYYGDEIAMPGAGDPDNRRMMVFDSLNPLQIKLKNTFKTLFNLRKNSMPLLYGEMEILKEEKDFLSYRRSYFGKEVVVIFNNSFEPKTVPINTVTYKKLFDSKLEENKIILAPKTFEILVKN